MKKSNRRLMREKSLQILYAFEINGEGLSSLLNTFLVDIPNGIDREFCENLINRVVANREIIDDKIQSRVNNWEMGRIAVIDKILISMGIAELMFFPDIPPKVSINEVIEIAKDYSTSKSGKFINGILDALLSEMKEEGVLNKTGRGLIDESQSRKSQTNESE